MTVKQRMENDLWGYELEPDDIYQAMPVIIKQINAESHYFLGLVHEDNPDKTTPLKDCWNTEETLYTEDSLEGLFRMVKNFAFRWCIAKINSMK